VLQLFRNYSPFTVIILVIAAFLMKLQALLHPVAPQAMPDHVLFASLLQVLGYAFESAFAYTLLTVAVLVSQALFINHITVKHKLFTKNTYLPAFSYLLLTSLNPAFNYFSEPLLINWLVLISVNIMMSLSQTTQPRKQIFNAAFAVCLPALFQFPAVGFILLFFLALVFQRSFNIGEWTVGLMGYLTPIYFFAGVLFLADDLHISQHIVQVGFAFPQHLVHPVYMIGTTAGLSILVFIGSIGLQQQLNALTIYIRRAWGLVYAYPLVSVLVTFIAVSFVNAEWLIIMPALSILIAHAFSFEKNKWFSNFTFYFSLLLLIFCQLALNK
jgi:hypothetical protein